MYHSPFYDMLYRENSKPTWRRLLPSRQPDLHMKDVEILLRGFAMLIDGENYAPSMVKFLNQFSRKCRTQSDAQNQYLSSLLESFLDACQGLPEDGFLKNGRFNVALFEASFGAICAPAFAEKRTVTKDSIAISKLIALEVDPEFVGALSEGTTQTRNVKLRLKRARELLR